MTMYDRIMYCCKEKGVTPGFVCNSLGVRRAMLSELKTGRTKSLSSENVAMFARYFNVSCDYLITGEEYHMQLDDDERILLNCWRRASDDERENVAFILRNLGMSLPKEEQELSSGSL